MKISIQQNEKVQIKFEGKINMEQEVIISKSDAKKLGEILTKEESQSFETE